MHLQSVCVAISMSACHFHKSEAYVSRARNKKKSIFSAITEVYLFSFPSDRKPLQTVAVEKWFVVFLVNWIMVYRRRRICFSKIRESVRYDFIYILYIGSGTDW